MKLYGYTLKSYSGARKMRWYWEKNGKRLAFKTPFDWTFKVKSKFKTKQLAINELEAYLTPEEKRTENFKAAVEDIVNE